MYFNITANNINKAQLSGFLGGFIGFIVGFLGGQALLDALPGKQF